MLEDKLLAVHGLAGVQSIQSYKALQAVVEDRSQPTEVLVPRARKALYAETQAKTLFGETAAPRRGGVSADGRQPAGSNPGAAGREHPASSAATTRRSCSRWRARWSPALYMLVRSVKMYDPDNAVFEQAADALQDTLNQIISSEGQLRPGGREGARST